MMLVLASGSEWRKKLMELLELPFEVVKSGVNEDQFEWEEPSEVVATLATMKAEAVRNKIIGRRNEEHDEGIIVIGADTLISVDDPPSSETPARQRIIGKPVDRESAKEIMTKLAGKTHEVWTGICVIDVVTGERVVEVEKTEVEFGLIGEKQLEKYLETKEWEGKAGGYQIQGAIKPFVKDVRGSYTNVIGLPMITLVDMLERLGVWVDEGIEERVEGLGVSYGGL